MVFQDNSDRTKVITDIRDALKEITGFKEISFTLRSPEEALVFPAAYIVGGTGVRTPADIQNVHFDQRMEAIVYLYWKEVAPGNLATELEAWIQKVVDKLDEWGQAVKISGGYDFYVSLVETDEGKLAATGMHTAMSILTVTALLPARDLL